jgi:hypothetical protein
LNKHRARLIEAMKVTAGAERRLRSSLTEDAELIARAFRLGGEDDADVLRAVDAFVQRFQQMLEHMLQRFYPALYRLEEGGERPPTRLELYRWVEERSLVDAALSWVERVETRNRLVHEYPLSPEDRSAALISAIRHANEMLDEYRLGIQRVEGRGLVDGSDG